MRSIPRTRLLPFANYVFFPKNLTDESQVASVKKVGDFALEVTYRTDRFTTLSPVQLYEFHPEGNQTAGGIAFGTKRQIRLSLLGPAHSRSLEVIRAEIGTISVI